MMRAFLRCVVAVGMLILLAGRAWAADALAALRAKLPVPGTVVFDTALDKLTYGGNDGVHSRYAVVDTDDPARAQALRVSVLQKGPEAWTVQLMTPASLVPVKRGDLMFVAVDLRCEAAAGGEGAVAASLQASKEPWTGVMGFQSGVSNRWKTLYAQGVADRDWPLGGIELTFHLASQVQTIDLANLVVLDLGQNVDAHALPYTPVTYAGRSADAAWRKVAQERIEKYRKGDLAVEVVDTADKPVTGARVHIALTRQAYSFGSFLEGPVLWHAGPLIAASAISSSVTPGPSCILPSIDSTP